MTHRFSCALLVLLALTACATRAPVRREYEASRDEVYAALAQQFDLVLERHALLAAETSDAAQAERNELFALAAGAVIRMVRVNPEADVRPLVRRLEAARSP